VNKGVISDTVCVAGVNLSKSNKERDRVANISLNSDSIQDRFPYSGSHEWGFCYGTCNPIK